MWSEIGDTIRVSLSADPVEEVKAGFEMLKSLGLRRRGGTVISCPSCARQQFEVIKTVERLEERLAHITTPLVKLWRTLRVPDGVSWNTVPQPKGRQLSVVGTPPLWVVP